MQVKSTKGSVEVCCRIKEYIHYYDTDDMGKESILIIVIAGIGDLVLASKSLRAVRNAFPDADIHLLTNSEAYAVACQYSYIDRVWAFPVRELRKDKRLIFNVFHLISALRKIKFASAINLFEVSSFGGAMKMGMLLLSIGAKRRIGCDEKGFGLFLTDRARPDTFHDRHRVDAMVDIAHVVGGISDDRGIEVFWDPQCEEKWDYLFEGEKDYPRDIVVGINPGGDWESKRWRPEHFAVVADRLVDMFNARIILLGGPGEKAVAQSIENAMKNEATNLAGKIDLNDLAYIISRFDLFLTNDSGPMHLAAATETPLVALFGPGNPALVRPYMPKRLYRLIYKDASCRPCRNEQCKQSYCLDAITPDEVFSHCADLLKEVKPELSQDLT